MLSRRRVLIILILSSCAAGAAPLVPRVIAPRATGITGRPEPSYGSTAPRVVRPGLCDAMLDGLEGTPDYEKMKKVLIQVNEAKSDHRSDDMTPNVRDFSRAARQVIIETALDEISRTPPPSALPQYPRPRRGDLTVPRKVLRTLSRTKGLTNVPYDIAVLGMSVSELTEAQAFEAGQRVVSQIQSAGAAAQRGELDTAIAILDDPSITRGTTFASPFHRAPLLTDLPVWDERTFAYQIIRMLPVPPHANGLGHVVLPAAPVKSSSPIQLAWAKKEWIRVAAEELGHVAQILFDRHDPSARISRMMAPERSVVRSIVALEGDRLNQNMPTVFGIKLRGFHDKEADIYAFLIETFGHEFIPNWVGIDSGYEIRRMIDDEYVRLGHPERAWPTTPPAPVRLEPSMPRPPQTYKHLHSAQPTYH